MKEKLILVIKGFIIGIGKIIPGVSGAMLAICLNVYDKGLACITNFFGDVKRNLVFLSYLMIGFILGIVSFSKIIFFFLNNYYFITMLFFIGLLFGGFINICKFVNKKNHYLIIFTSLLILLLTISNINNNYIIRNNLFDYLVFAFGGMLDAIATVVPGISGMALLSILGIYDKVILYVSNFSNMNLLFTFIFFLLLGIIITSLIINTLLSKYTSNTYSIIIGIILSSIIILIFKVFSLSFSYKELIIGLILLLLGYIISKYLDK